MAQSTALTTALLTSLALIDQFTSSLDPQNPPQPQQFTNHPSPLHLLTASATSLKSSVTKISLLAITTPFTPSAITSTLQPLNTNVLPSLVTATLLASPTIYPKSFAKECGSLTRAALRDLHLLLRLVKARSEDPRSGSDIADNDKKSITEATGKVWEDCDLLVNFSDADVADFVCKKAKQWLDLMKDAVQEFQDWDPAEEIGDDPFGLNNTTSDNGHNSIGPADKQTDQAAMSAGVKDQALKVLSRIPQSIHVVLKQRLEKMPRDKPSNSNEPMIPMPTARRLLLDKVLRKTMEISECIDESAEAMYMGDPELCLKKAGEARALTIDVVETVFQPWQKSDRETKEDQYMKRALTWIQQTEAKIQDRTGADGNQSK